MSSMTEASAPHKELQARVQRCVTSWQEHLARQSATLQAAVNQHVEGAHHGIQALGQQLARLRVPPPAQRPQPSVLLAVRVRVLFWGDESVHGGGLCATNEYITPN